MTEQRHSKDYIDLTGQRFGRLTVLHRDHDIVHGKRHEVTFLCKCDCGNTKLVRSRHLRGGNVKSCGCLEKENLSKLMSDRITHGGSGTRLYEIWCKIKDRCTNKHSPAYARYGGRGIKLCDSWKDFAVFQSWAMENGYNDTLTIDRIDNNKGYEPSNCRWATMTIQANNKRCNRTYIDKGIRKTIAQLSEEYGIPYQTLHARLTYYKWPLEKAVSVSVEDSKKIPSRARYITFNGETKTLTDWAKSHNMSLSGLRSRLKKGWSIEQALNTPVLGKGD